jgi:hypothetical protein
MHRRISLLALLALCLCSLAGAAASSPATDPGVPAQAPAGAASPAPDAAPALLQPAATQSLLPPAVKDAPPGAVLLNACSQACLITEIQCMKGCGTNQRCKQVCANDYTCCVQACIPNSWQCP